MSCHDMLERICAELQEDIDSEVCLEVRRHLEECPDCRAYVDSLKKTVYLYRRIPDERLPDEVRERLYKKLKL